MINKSIYLDASATCPPLDIVVKEISRIDNNIWGNPSSLHAIGVKASEILESSRISIAKNFNVNPDQVIFTSGATESINLALKGIASNYSPGRIVISSVEHPAVVYAAKSLIDKGWSISFWPVDNYGMLDTRFIEEMLSFPTKIVSIISGQSEIGTTQPIRIIAKECIKRNIYMHTDATQVISQGLVDFSDIDVSSLSASSHKFRGPKGIGLLILKEECRKILKSLQEGGEQEFSLRAGTEPVSLVHGMSIALDNIGVKANYTDQNLNFATTKVTSFTQDLRSELSTIEGLRFTGHPNYRLPNHISFLACSKDNNPVDGRKLVKELSNKGLFISSGSACSSRKNPESTILEAIGTESRLLRSGLRISLGNWLEDLDTRSVCDLISSTIDVIAS